METSAFDEQCGRWFAVAVVGKMADVLVTTYGIRSFGAGERNPIAAAVFESYGQLSGSFILSCAVLVGILVVTETGVSRCLRSDVSEDVVFAVRSIGYLVPGSFWLLVAGYNLFVVSQLW